MSFLLFFMRLICILQPAYLANHILAKDPFVTLDVRGVGSLVSLAVSKCKKANSAIKVRCPLSS